MERCVLWTAREGERDEERKTQGELSCSYFVDNIYVWIDKRNQKSKGE